MKSTLLGISLVSLFFVAPSISAAEELFDTSASNEIFQNGMTFYYQQQYDAAIEAFQKAIAINPDNAKAHYYLGYTHYKIGQFQKALRHFETAYQINHAYTPIPPESQNASLLSNATGP